MRLVLVNRDREVSDVLRWQFREHPEVEIVTGRFEDLPDFDCVVTPGNSFGLMDAGMDLAVLRFFGTELQERLQQQILQDYLGEQPVGSCILLPTGNPKHPFVAHSPSMRVPMNVSGTDNVYLAFWAVLTAVHRHNRNESRKINVLACPGLGTGGMECIEAALQMEIAFRHFKRPLKHINPTVAQERHERIHYGGKWGFEHPRG